MRSDILRRTAALAALCLLATGCEWFSDFKQQPKIKPWQANKMMMGDTIGVKDTVPMRGNPQFSVPITGMAVAGIEVSYAGSLLAGPGAAPSPATIDSMSDLVNPTPPSPESLDNGRKYYQINCAVCHGPGGHGNGPAVRYGVPAPNLLTPVTVGRTDGYIFGMIRNGRGLMPTYDRIEDMARWDVVNYVRALQGRLGVQPDTTPAGTPGENGAKVPGATQTAPTRPVPYFHPGRTERP